jgi:hypothetical protein
VRWFRADDEFNNLATSNQHVSFSVADAVYRHNSWPIDDSGYDTIEQLYAAVWPPNSRTDNISTEAKEMVQGLLRTSSTKRLGMIMPRYIIAHRIAHCARFRFHAPAAPVRHGTVWRLRRPTPAVLLSQLRLASPARGAPCCAAACSYPYPFAVAAIPEGTSTSAPHSRGVMSAVRHFSGSLPCQRHDSIHDAHHDVCVTVGPSQLVHARVRLDI